LNKSFYCEIFQRSTPRTDTFWGGKSELAAVGGFENNGVTTIVFRKKLEATEPTDHSIEDDLMHVIWAKGQEPGKAVHFPPSEVENEGLTTFYKADELKYHGHQTQRGVTQINFFDVQKQAVVSKTGNVPVSKSYELDNECQGFWQFPRDCNVLNHTCEYYAKWETVGRGDEMKFYIETSNTNTWTGIGFSDNQKMTQTDAVVGWVDPRTGRPFLMDTWVIGFAPPRLDEQQDIYNISGIIKDGVTILEFVRKRVTDDKDDLSFTEEHCLFMMFPVKGGSFNAVNKRVRKHEAIPVVTDERVCIKSCGLDSRYGENAPTTPAPNRLAYAVQMKLVNLAEGFEAPKKGSQEYEELSRTIQDTFNGVLGEIPGYYKLDEIEFNKYVLNFIY
jgi:hypothetical protein